MKKFLALLSAVLLFSGCWNSVKTDPANKDLPAIVFLARYDISEIIDPEEAESQNIPVTSLSFFDKNGDYYVSDDPSVNALDNFKLLAEYEKGSLSEKIRFVKSVGADFTAEQYKTLRKVCLKEDPEIVYPEYVPAVQAERSSWYGFYLGKSGELQTQIIHSKGNMTQFYTNSEKLNEVYKKIIGSPA